MNCQTLIKQWHNSMRQDFYSCIIPIIERHKQSIPPVFSRLYIIFLLNYFIEFEDKDFDLKNTSTHYNFSLHIRWNLKDFLHVKTDITPCNFNLFTWFLHQLVYTTWKSECYLLSNCITKRFAKFSKNTL